jgi:hypothetical protein
VTVPSKWGSSESFKSLDFWLTCRCLATTQQKGEIRFCGVYIVFRCRYKGWKKSWPEILQIDKAVVQCRKFASRTTQSLYLGRGLEHLVTPMPGVKLQSPIRDLIPIESLAGPSQDKGKGRAVDLMDEGKSERERSVSLTMSESEGAFHGGSLAFVYDWINDEHGNSSPEGPRESIDDWLTDQSYMDANEEPIE